MCIVELHFIGRAYLCFQALQTHAEHILISAFPCRQNDILLNAVGRRYVLHADTALIAVKGNRGLFYLMKVFLHRFFLRHEVVYLCLQVSFHNLFQDNLCHRLCLCDVVLCRNPCFFLGKLDHLPGNLIRILFVNNFAAAVFVVCNQHIIAVIGIGIAFLGLYKGVVNLFQLTVFVLKMNLL